MFILPYRFDAPKGIGRNEKRDRSIIDILDQMEEWPPRHV